MARHLLTVDVDSRLGERVAQYLFRAGFKPHALSSSEAGLHALSAVELGGTLVDTQRQLLSALSNTEKVIITSHFAARIEAAHQARTPRVVVVVDNAVPERDLRALECAIRAEASWLLLRVESFMDDLLPRIAVAAATGIFWSACPKLAARPISLDDAALATAVLVDADDTHQLANLYGPSSLTHSHIAAAASRTLNRRIVVRTASPVELLERLAACGLNRALAARAAALDAHLMTREEPAAAADTERAIGVSMEKFSTYLLKQTPRLLAWANSVTVTEPADRVDPPARSFVARCGAR